jgi:glycosyltransferase involved in cell wall biosynthesis
VDYYGGIVCLLTRLMGVRGRIVHSHNNTRAVDRVASFPRRMYTRSMKLLVRWFSTAGLGTSGSAAALMFGDGWSLEPRWKVLPACVDLAPFGGCSDRGRVRGELGIPDSAIVFGHVGRFVEQKNHEFLIRLAAILVTKEPRARFVLIGTGPTQQLAEDTIRECGLTDHITIFAPRDDIPRIMLGAFDFFLFPSLYEGLGLALVEAQAAGLSCFASTAIPPEAIVVPSLVHRFPLAGGPEYWADAILRRIGESRPVTQTEALRQVELAFDIRRNAAQLVKFYQAAL